MLFGKTVKKILLNCSMNIDQLRFLNKLPEDLEEKVEVFSRLQLKTATEKPVNMGFHFSSLFYKNTYLHFFLEVLPSLMYLNVLIIQNIMISLYTPTHHNWWISTEMKKPKRFV